MGSLYVKNGTKLWARYKNERGIWKGAPTGFSVGDEDKARQVLAGIEKEVAARRAAGVVGPLTVMQFARKWHRERRALKVADAPNEESRLRLHAKPLHDLPLADVRVSHLRELVVGLVGSGKLAPRTVRHVYATLVSLFGAAEEQGLILASPCKLGSSVLPAKVDKDPRWRATAIFARREVEQIISDDRIPTDRRVLSALKAFTGMRHGEVEQLEWRDYEPEREPLGCINLGETKTDVPRQVPVHHELAAILAAWKLSGWASMMGERPGPNDLIIPTRNKTARTSREMQKAFLEDLEKLELRARRGHDFRRTFISLALEDGANRDALRAVTHGLKRDVFDSYTTFTWGALCEAVGKLRLARLQGACYSLATRVGRWRLPSTKVVTPSGLEAEICPPLAPLPDRVLDGTTPANDGPARRGRGRR